MALVVVGVISFGVGIVAAFFSTVTYLFVAALISTAAAIGFGLGQHGSVAMALTVWAASALVMQVGFVASIGFQAMQKHRARASRSGIGLQEQQIPVVSPDISET